ncbi:hypothetical protein [Altibacter sp.]|uniref:hypothetical protein n=1 Tax=Altibacter sp. TaxID=2024823 RepID=UPI000C8DB327|nr:hypothetical protein [Altibacter sp.]MAP55162.1 hypothetical protein [Altibacter sp.]|tara:strand:- start:172 stop:777 length:606 start_codon:yes stop_codon:yes gene_type:complete
MFTSCKDDDATDDQSGSENFYALKIGNTWTYNYFYRIGDSDDFENLNVTEKVEITGTTTENTETYFVFTTTTTGDTTHCPLCPDEGVTNRKLRDSLGFLVDEIGAIYFSRESVSDYLISENEWGNVYGVLQPENFSIEVPAGQFSCLNNEVYAILDDGTSSQGRDEIYYSDGIGYIFRKSSTVNNPQHMWEKRLMSYELVE